MGVSFFPLRVTVDGFALASNFLIIRLSLTGSMKYSDDPLSESGTDDSLRVVALFAECGLSCCFATVLLTIAMFECRSDIKRTRDGLDWSRGMREAFGDYMCTIIITCPGCN